MWFQRRKPKAEKGRLAGKAEGGEGPPAVGPQHEVLGDVEVAHQSLLVTVLRDEPQQADRPERPLRRSPLDRDPPPGDRPEAGDALHQLPPAVALAAGPPH